MKYPEEHKANVYNKLLQSAAKQIRKNGLTQTSVKSVMDSQKMTVGGFYAHFKSKDKMLSQALHQSFVERDYEFYDKLEQRSDEEWLQKTIERYLSDYHRDHITESCPAAAMMGDMPRANAALRAAYEEELQTLLGKFEKRLRARCSSKKEAEQYAMGLLAMLTGGLQLARSVKSKEYSEKLLKNCFKSANLFIDSI